jgi:pimeloyl-ACP methyl ester carboxylesterase
MGAVEASQRFVAAVECQAMRPVLFIHGSGLDASTWTPMREAFLAAGYPASWLLALSLSPADGANRSAAQGQIAPAVERLLAQGREHPERASGKDEMPSQAGVRAACAAPRRIDIIAHSMGAVSARWYIAHIDAARVRNLVGIAPANHGSDALCGLPGEGNRELCPAFARDPRRNAVQVELNGTRARRLDETPFGPGEDGKGIDSIRPDEQRRVQYTMFRLDPDQWIRPARSALLDGAGGLTLHGLIDAARVTSPGNVLWPAGVTHDDLPRDPRLIRIIVTSLQQDVSE